MKKNILLLALFAIAAILPAKAAEADFEAEAPLDIATEIDAEFQDVQIAVSGTQVTVSNASGLTLEVYNVAGVRVGSYRIDSDEKTVSLNLQHGCYILKVGKIARKISIR